MTDVYRVPLGGSGGGLFGLKQRGCVYAYPFSDDGLWPLAEAKEAGVGAAVCHVSIN